MSGIVGSKLNIRGSGLVGSLGTDGQHLLSAGAGKTNVFETAAGGGKVNQVVQTVMNGTTSGNNSSFTDISGMTCDITPSASDSKILISVSAIWSGNASYSINIRWVRDSTVIFAGTSAGSRPLGFFGYQGVEARGCQQIGPAEYLDSPNTTSAVTYHLEWRNQCCSNTHYLGRTYNDNNGTEYDVRAASSITLMEILA